MATSFVLQNEPRGEAGMTETRFKIAELDKARLQKVRELEEKLGTYVGAD